MSISPRWNLLIVLEIDSLHALQWPGWYALLTGVWIDLDMKPTYYNLVSVKIGVSPPLLFPHGNTVEMPNVLTDEPVAGKSLTTEVRRIDKTRS